MSCLRNTENGLHFKPLESQFLFPLKIDFIIIHIFRLVSPDKLLKSIYNSVRLLLKFC